MGVVERAPGTRAATAVGTVSSHDTYPLAEVAIDALDNGLDGGRDEGLAARERDLEFDRLRSATCT